ncbi:uncharacterized protein METZ01_LOCUS418954, partial [marine metagenome]
VDFVLLINVSALMIDYILCKFQHDFTNQNHKYYAIIDIHIFQCQYIALCSVM